MAAANAYRVKSVTWKSSALPGVVDCSESDSTEGVTKHRTDNATAVQSIFLDGIGASITVTTTDLSLRGAANYALGQTGALVVVRELRAKGTGAVAASDKTATYSEATLVSVREGTPIAGRGTLEITWEASDSTNGASVVTHS